MQLYFLHLVLIMAQVYTSSSVLLSFHCYFMCPTSTHPSVHHSINTSGCTLFIESALHVALCARHFQNLVSFHPTAALHVSCLCLASSCKQGPTSGRPGDHHGPRTHILLSSYNSQTKDAYLSTLTINPRERTGKPCLGHASILE